MLKHADSAPSDIGDGNVLLICRATPTAHTRNKRCRGDYNQQQHHQRPRYNHRNWEKQLENWDYKNPGKKTTTHENFTSPRPCPVFPRVPRLGFHNRYNFFSVVCSPSGWFTNTWGGCRTRKDNGNNLWIPRGSCPFPRGDH